MRICNHKELDEYKEFFTEKNSGLKIIVCIEPAKINMKADLGVSGLGK